MEFLEGLEYLITETAFILSHARIFVIALGAAFVVVFWGLLMISLSIRQLQRDVTEIKMLIDFEEEGETDG